MVIGALVGLALGFLPLIMGMKKNQPGLALGGFFACIIAGALGGLIIAAPVGAIFWWLIKKAPNNSKDFRD